MRELHQDLWSVRACARVVTTNGIVRANGLAVMGAGCALQAAQRFPSLPRELGALLRSEGNRVHLFPAYRLATLPTKHDWRKPSDLRLILDGCQQLVDFANQRGWPSVVLPRPGCGLGGLDWGVVGPYLVSLFDDRFIVVY